eukprot:CAMPEP_0113317006 /NCGR_PEP_ID=MMETSP0010_2-20120614/12071_1 /TAXON_ID=216773 ORGANISM="Corethron hystrix, Strain 308" /NCGR_SAMPLE_ID=MMETSP0010_2 /ASSEMBLY_ACC=CAM_ASM_000155 /LENGTH=223 /DNA_ID=CAMNT_0000173869 /DNA_START=63 /DNA_END=734 /DNA_ORIENTATION=- /assembly_acc=CAM_ASM_000155
MASEHPESQDSSQQKPDSQVISEQAPNSFEEVQFYASPPNPPDVSSGEPTTNSMDNVIPKEKLQKGLAVAGTAVVNAWRWTKTRTDEVGKNINKKMTELPETQVGKQVNRGLTNAATGLNSAGQRIAQTTSVVTENIQKGAVVAKDNVVSTSRHVGVSVGNVVNDVRKNPAVANATEKIGQVTGNLIKRATSNVPGDAAQPTHDFISPAAMESSAVSEDKRVA